jgi:hypothetical protein
MGKIKKIQNSMNHKPFNPKSSAHRDFAQKQLEQIHLLMQEAPYLDLAAEITYFNRIIN